MTSRAALLLPAIAALALVPATPALAFFANWEISLQRALSGMKVTASQSSATSLQSTNGYKSSAEATAAAVTSQDNAARLARAQHEYGFDTGTGYAACTLARGIVDNTHAFGSATKVRDAYRVADATWLTVGGDAAERSGGSLQQRRTFYCSPYEMLTGWCASSGLGGYGAGDSDASPWLLNRNYGGEEVMTASDYLDVVAPLPTVRPNPVTAEDDLALIRARREGAIMSGARATLIGVITGGMGGDRPAGSTP